MTGVTGAPLNNNLGLSERIDMGYFVRAKKNGFKVIKETWLPERKQELIALESWPALGFYKEMTLEAAKQRAKQINIQSKIEANRITSIAKRVEEDKLADSAYLPNNIVLSFESYLDSLYEDNPERLNNIIKQWSILKKMINHLKLDPKDFSNSQSQFYLYFRQKKWGLDYIKKLTWLINLWGLHYSKQFHQYYEPLQSLSLTQKEKINDAREDLTDIKRAADPLIYLQLINSKNKFTDSNLEKQYNWLFIALWFGLRPKELDSILKDKHYKIEFSKELSCNVLHIYQSKLITKPKNERWKIIPAFLNEQKQALQLLINKEAKEKF